MPELTIRHASKKKIRTRGYTHLFRKSCGTALLKAGMDLDDIMHKLGHTDISMTSRYLTGSTNEKVKNLEKNLFN